MMVLETRGVSSMKNDKLSVFLSLILRHKPEAAGIKLDEHGWANVDELLSGINMSGRTIDLFTLEEIVKSDQKQRYSFNEDKSLIRANQGHSILVDVELKEQIPPEVLYHGTAQRFVEAIKKDGLKPMRRLYVHLSLDIDTAIKVGKRHGSPVILKTYSGDMHRDGKKFYMSENGVWLTKAVDCNYIEQIEL